ncbi:MAG: hypothetical protein [Wendovervirus sonii]|uniref:Uncharacterized protein n=1 Tax=phage Lak_Megaphage_Sonny TaxID=3109229 RepID=A0ABZ0Z6W2_9CAUD|nr:MAG: hypothetical protein [phage Lak_Megaphage_Sonny]
MKEILKTLIWLIFIGLIIKWLISAIGTLIIPLFVLAIPVAFIWILCKYL